MRVLVFFVAVILLTAGIAESMNRVPLQPVYRCCLDYGGPVQGMLSLFAGLVTLLITIPAVCSSEHVSWQTCASLAGGAAGVIGGSRNLAQLFQGRHARFVDSIV